MGPYISIFIPENNQISLIAVIMMGSGIYNFFSKVLKKKPDSVFQKPLNVLPSIGLGLFLGFFQSLFGAAGGLITVMILINYYRFSSRYAAGSTALLGLISSLVASVGYILRGINCDFSFEGCVWIS
jgi:uncharacterized membrane protein YfcA